MELTGFGKNRISAAIAKCDEQIKARLASGAISEAQVERARMELDFALPEYVAFQNLKSLAATDGKLSLDEAQMVYRYLGETPDTFNNQPIAIKRVLSEVFTMLGRQYAGVA